jgi:hypothetical protein
LALLDAQRAAANANPMAVCKAFYRQVRERKGRKEGCGA